VSVLARMAFEIALWSDGAYEIAVVCEEAHRYIPTDQSQAFGPTRTAIGRIAKEGRKYGVSLGIVTQRPSELDATVLSQCSTMFAMRLSNEADKAIVRSAVGVSSASTIAFLSSIADREAIAFGEAIATPMRMKFSDYRDESARPAFTGTRSRTWRISICARSSAGCAANIRPNRTDQRRDAAGFPRRRAQLPQRNRGISRSPRRITSFGARPARLRRSKPRGSGRWRLWLV
jgi:hypothetical protein